MMWLKKIRDFFYLYPIAFIIGYIVLNYLVVVGSLGGNTNQGLQPFFLLLLTIFFGISSDSFLMKWDHNKSKHLLFWTVNINIIFFLFGKVNRESSLFEIIHKTSRIDFKIILVFYCLVIMVLYFNKKYKDVVLKYYYIFPLLVFFILTVSIPTFFPEPHIDLFTILKNSNHIIISGKDPYKCIYPDIYNGEFDYAYQKQEIRLVYWPLSLYLTFPFQLLFGDFRYAYIFYILVSALVVYFYSSKYQFFNSLSLLLLFFTNSFTFYMIKYSWIDLLAIPLFVIVFMTLQKRKFIISFVFLGLLGALKLYYIFLLPLFLIYIIKNKNFWIKSIILYSIVLLTSFFVSFLPFLYTNFKGLAYTVEYFNNSKPRLESLSFPGLIFRSRIDLSTLFTALTLIFLGAIYLISFINKGFNIYKLLKYVSLVLLVSFIFAKQAFGNYYYNITILMIIYFMMTQEEKVDLNYEK